MANKNYRVNIGTVKGAAFWNEPKEQGKQGYYSVTLARSVKDQNGNWVESKINLFPNELTSMAAILQQLQRVVLQPVPFEIQRQDNGYAQPAASQPATSNAAALDAISDDIPF